MRVAVVPVKNLAQAKSRLARILSPDQREKLCLAMLRDVLRVLCITPEIDEVRVVACDRKVLSEALAAGAVPCMDHSESLNGALTQVASELDPSDGMLIVPGDVPLIRVSEVRGVLRAGQNHGAIVRTGDGGTGALCLHRSDAMEFRFGPDSFRQHLATACRQGLSMTICQNAAGFTEDIDGPDDLQIVLRGGRTESARLVAGYLGMG